MVPPTRSARAARVCCLALAAAASATVCIGGSGSAAFAQPLRARGGGPLRRSPAAPAAPSAPALPPRLPTGRDVLAGLLAVVAAASLALPAAYARDGAVAPPTCVSIVNARDNCPGRSARGSLSNAEAQLKGAQEALRKAEKEKGAPIEEGTVGGEPEMVNFYQAEVQRLQMNQMYLQDVRKEMTSPQARYVSRLSYEVKDTAVVQKEIQFWAEATGMQQYADLPGGGATVGYGPSDFVKDGDEGGYFAIDILPASSAQAGATKGPLKLSYVQVATPSLIRISKVIASGGELLDGYGYYGLKSPGGVEVRAYVDDRRDPFEMVVMVAEPGEMAAAQAQLAGLGLEARGEYKQVSPVTQQYMPTVPPGSVLYGFGDAKDRAQVLVVSKAQKKAKSFTSWIPKSGSLSLSETGAPEVDVIDQDEELELPVSTVTGLKLTVLAPSGAAAPPAPDSVLELKAFP